MVSWANSGRRDLHLDLRSALTPGARGAKDALIGALRDAVRSGRLRPGTALPPSRTLATDLGLARNTVADAYSELVAEALGEHVFDFFLRNKRTEWENYRSHVTPFELKTYLSL